jgi:hypothetical protein
MANSGILWIDAIFDWAVFLLVDAAKFMGITYEEINVWLFCIVWPLATLVMMALALWLWRENVRLRQNIRVVVSQADVATHCGER